MKRRIGLLLCCMLLLGSSCPSPPQVYAQAAASRGGVRLVVCNTGGTPAKRAEICLWLSDRPHCPLYVTVSALPAHARRVVAVPCVLGEEAECRVASIQMEK